MKSGNDAEAGQILRQLWRAFPQVVESPYGYRMRQKNFNGLRWPSDLAPRIVKEPDEDEIRRRLRGGLATFETSTRKKTSTAVPDSIWKILAAEPFGIAEMKRILRSRSAFELDSVDEVALGLLLADRRARGDDVVFEELVGAVKQGRVGSVEWNQLLAMIEKNPARINSENQFMVEELVKKTDLSQLNRVSRLAWLCGKIGQKKRSASLFVHCSLLAQSKGVTFTSLIKKAREIFKGDELMALAERMFEVAVTNDAAISTMLDLRIEILDAEQVARKSSELFAKLDSDPTDLSTQQARYGVQIFSRASQFQKARQCLKAAMLSSSKPIQNPSPYYNSGVRPRTRLTRVDLIEMFPQDGTSFDDYAKWLTEAAQEIGQTVSNEEFDTTLSVELLLVIAIRQVQQNAIDAAALTLRPLLEKTLGEQVLEKAKTHELLAIDVLHLAKQYEPAYKLQYALYTRDQLSPVRYGDLLRDTLRVKGKDNALMLLEELLLKSLHEDLLEVALKIWPPDSPLSMRIIKLRQQSQAADAEYRKRSEAARQRDAKRGEGD